MSDDKKKSKRQLEKEQKIKHPLLNRKERDRRAWQAHQHQQEAAKPQQQDGPMGGFSKPANNPAVETDMMKPLSSMRGRILKSRAKMKAKWKER